MIQSIYLLSIFVGAVALPKFSWDTVSLYAHCGNVSGPLEASTARFFSTVGFVTFEKFHDLYGDPIYSSVENKIADAAKLVKSFGTTTEVLMYYQNDWTRTWYDSGVWFEQQDRLLLRDKNNDYVISPVEYNHTFNAFDFAVQETQDAWVNATLVLVDQGICDGVFIDG